jgi:hypothetical protein
LKEQHNDRLDASRREREINATRKVVAPRVFGYGHRQLVVLRVYTGGITSYSLALRTVPFAAPDEARAWVKANKADVTYHPQLSDS